MERLNVELNVREILQREVKGYATASLDGTAYSVCDSETNVYAAILIGTGLSLSRTLPIVVARIEGDTIIIETDMTNKPLVDALEAAGIPRDQIILAYEQET